MMTAVTKLELGINRRFLMAIPGLFWLKHCTLKVLYIMVYKCFVCLGVDITHEVLECIFTTCRSSATLGPGTFQDLSSVQGAHREYITLLGLPWEVTPIEFVTVIKMYCLTVLL